MQSWKKQGFRKFKIFHENERMTGRVHLAPKENFKYISPLLSSLSVGFENNLEGQLFDGWLRGNI